MFSMGWSRGGIWVRRNRGERTVRYDAFSKNPPGPIYRLFSRPGDCTWRSERGAENVMSILMRFWRDETAATAIEYGLIAVGISVVIVTAVNSIGTNVKGLFTNVSTGLSNVGK
jgi:pilus assembly protein Flp/PilA